MSAGKQTTEPFSWNTHYLLTLHSLERFPWDILDERVEVTPLEAFIESAGQAILRLALKHRAAVAAKTGVQVPFHATVLHESQLAAITHGGGSEGAVSLRLRGRPGAESPPTRPERSPYEDTGQAGTAREFLAALHLNPQTRIHYVRSTRREELAQRPSHDPSRNSPPAAGYDNVMPGSFMTGREIVATFSDEPDWGMDQDLFDVPGFPYGSPPYGPPSGKSSQASFHMAFFHEPRLLLLLWPRLRTNFLRERIRLFLDLARLASNAGNRYWMLRFGAWAAHYLQDITQPYHARALPFPWLPILKRVLADPSPGRLKRAGQSRLMNRHFLFEAVVHFILNEAFKDCSDHEFFRALRNQEPQEPSSEATSEQSVFAPDLDRLVTETSGVAAGRAVEVNSLLEGVLDDPAIDEQDYFARDDPAYLLQERVQTAVRLRPAIVVRFVELVAECLRQTGMVTRRIAGMLTAPS